MKQSQSSKPKRKRLEEVLTESQETKLALIQHHMELTRLLINHILAGDQEAFTGKRYARSKPYGGRYVRWGYNPGSVRVGSEKIPVDVPRVVDREEGASVPLPSYEALKELPETDEKLREAVLLGLSTHDYDRVTRTLLDGFGLSQSAVSRQFVEASAEVLKEFEERSLADTRFIALVIDGKYLAKQQMVICLGITEDGRKQALGFIQTTTENAAAISELLRDVIARGLRFEEGLFFVIDGSKGLSKAIKEVFGEYAVIQRCQYHKRQNVLSYLTEEQQQHFKGKLDRAQKHPDYETAKKALAALHGELSKVNRSAARSLLEGLEETLTLQRLGLYEELRWSLRTTNSIESLNGHLRKYLGRIRYWRTSDQRARWLACALTEMEENMKRIMGKEALPKLRAALINEINKHHDKRAA